LTELEESLTYTKSILNDAETENKDLKFQRDTLSKEIQGLEERLSKVEKVKFSRGN
jgi:hypothetical protein